MCMEPVGEGAIRVTTGRSDIELEEAVGSTPQAPSEADGRRWARPLSTPFRGAPSLAGAWAWLAAQPARQAERRALWAPVAFGVGAAVYFTLPGEPVAGVAVALLALAAGLFGASRDWRLGRGAAIGLGLAAFAVAGFAGAKLRTEQVRAPIAPPGGAVRTIEGHVLDVASPGRKGGRLLIAPVRIEGLAPEATPIRVRITLRDPDGLPAPGEPVRLRAILNAPPPPASPGAYDFARDAFFEGIGGVGFALAMPQAADLPDPPWRLELAMRVNALRWALARRIVAGLGPETGGLAAAMVTGHEAFVPREQVEDMRDAGLAHIISISGLHMAIVGGFAFAAVRLGIAAWPWAALRISGKKVAAVAGLAAVMGYLLISGAPPPAQRAAITAAVAFGAILADRRAISLHALAVAALAILAFQPEAVTEPGFQMSFAATTALVALAEAWPRPVKEINTPWPIRLAQGAGVWIAASVGASLVAGLATGPFAMQHFNRVSTYGLAANLAVAPISSFLMMPALALGAALTPFGLGEAPLAAAGLGIGAMTKIAALAAAQPGATLLVASAPDWTLPAAFLGVLWLCLWRGPLRWVGLPFALAVALCPRAERPDAWVASDGAAVAVRRGEAAVLLRPDVKRFGAEFWAQRRGLAVPPDGLGARNADFQCERWACAPRAGAPRIAAVWSRRPVTAERLGALCGLAEVVIVRGEADRRACRGALLLTASDFARGGAAELYRAAGGWRVVWAQDLRGRRPWTTVSGSGG